jgi:hypothetical protein
LQAIAEATDRALHLVRQLLRQRVHGVEASIPLVKPPVAVSGVKCVWAERERECRK